MDIKTGDEVRVLARPSHGSPPTLLPGTVIKTGRKYGIAEYEVEPASRPYGAPAGPVKHTVEFTLATGYPKGDDYGVSTRVLTMEMAAIRERKDAAQATIVRAGITVNGGWGRFSVEQLEAMAAAVAGFPEYDRSR